MLQECYDGPSTMSASDLVTLCVQAVLPLANGTSLEGLKASSESVETPPAPATRPTSMHFHLAQ
jgi:hypothetical protein